MAVEATPEALSIVLEALALLVSVKFSHFYFEIRWFFFVAYHQIIYVKESSGLENCPPSTLPPSKLEGVAVNMTSIVADAIPD